MKKNRRIIKYLIFLIIWLLITFVLSAMTGNESNKKSKNAIKKATVYIQNVTSDSQDKKMSENQLENLVEKLNIILRKVAHASIYFGLSVLMCAILFHIKKGDRIICNTLCIITCIICAGFDEYHQTLVEGRTGQLTDVLIDLSGAILGCMIFNIGKNILSKKATQKKMKNISKKWEVLTQKENKLKDIWNKKTNTDT